MPARRCRAFGITMAFAENPFLFLFDFIGGLVCHQLPERTFWVGGHYLPVCARDTGAYLGLLLGYFLLPIRRKEARGPPNLWITSLMLAPMIIDGLTQWMGVRTSTNELRLMTGLFFGVALSPFLVYLLSVVPSSKEVPILRKYLPETAELDNRNLWLSNWALGLGSLIAVASFLAVISVVGSINLLFYWTLSSLIIISVIWHIMLLPFFLVILLLFSLKNKGG
jgi:uncharacterized membrane protein